VRVLIACEYSGRVRQAFRSRGHDAWSCDLFEPAEDGSPWHRSGDAGRIAYEGGWDLMIAHPPCTHLAVSGAAHFKAKRADGRQQEAIDFFLTLAHAPIPRIAVENPVCIMSSAWREPDQIIQPHEFGHPEFKATCLWLKGLPSLRPTNPIAPPASGTDVWKAWNRVHRMSPGPERWKERSRTYEGIAEAMADQWSNATPDLVTQMERPWEPPTPVSQMETA
jgi:hypothetical protein